MGASGRLSEGVRLRSETSILFLAADKTLRGCKMLMRFWVTIICIAQISCFVLSSIEVDVVEGDRVVFFGDSTIVSGQTADHGFIKILKEEANLYHNISIEGAGQLGFDIDKFGKEQIDHYMFHYDPTIAVLMVTDDEIDRIEKSQVNLEKGTESDYDSLKILGKQVERILSHIAHIKPQCKLVICTPMIPTFDNIESSPGMAASRQKMTIDGSRVEDLHETFSAIMKRMAHDYANDNAGTVKVPVQVLDLNFQIMKYAHQSRLQSNRQQSSQTVNKGKGPVVRTLGGVLEGYSKWLDEQSHLIIAHSFSLQFSLHNHLDSDKNKDVDVDVEVDGVDNDDKAKFKSDSSNLSDSSDSSNKSDSSDSNVHERIAARLTSSLAKTGSVSYKHVLVWHHDARKRIDEYHRTLDRKQQVSLRHL